MAVIELRLRPTLGFEYEGCNADIARRQDLVQKGYKDDQIEQELLIARWATNFFKVVGYFVPLVGLGRIITGSLDGDWAEVARGVAELAELGLLLLIADIGMTIYRELDARHIRTV